MKYLFLLLLLPSTVFGLTIHGTKITIIDNCKIETTRNGVTKVIQLAIKGECHFATVWCSNALDIKQWKGHVVVPIGVKLKGFTMIAVDKNGLVTTSNRKTGTFEGRSTSLSGMDYEIMANKLTNMSR